MTTMLRKIWKYNSKHKKLSEEWALAECDGDGWWKEAKQSKKQHYDIRYAGTATVERAASAPATQLAVRAALQSAKASNKKLQKVNLDISPKGIVVTDAETQDNLLSVSIYRISYCSADAANARIFAVVEGKSTAGGETHTAHVFVCNRRRYARALALSLAHAFNDAFQAWQSSATSFHAGGNGHVAPWVNFTEDEEDVEEAAAADEWHSVAPLVSFS